MRIRSRIDVMRTEYNTDDPHNPKEIATLYDVFDYVDSKKGETVFFIAVVRQKSRIVHRESYDNVFINAMVKYHRLVRGRAQDIHPVAKSIQELERTYEGVIIEP